MSSEIVKKHLNEIKKQGKFDLDFIDVLTASNDENEEGEETAEKIVSIIRERYAKNKENNTKGV